MSKSKNKLELAEDFLNLEVQGTGMIRKIVLKATLHNFQIQTLAEDVVLTTYFVEDQTRERNAFIVDLLKGETPYAIGEIYSSLQP